MFADFTNCISGYYMLRKLKPKDAAKLFSRLCNQFRHTDIVSNHELMRMLEYNPKQITRIVQIKHQYHCDTLEKIVKAYNTKVHLQHQQEYQNQQKEVDMFGDNYDGDDVGDNYDGNDTHKHRTSMYNPYQQQQFRKEKQLAMEKCIIKSQARILWSECSGIDSVSYSEIFNILKREFREQTNSIRIFEQNHQSNQYEMSLVSFIQKFKKIDRLYDWNNNTTHMKVDVYFGRGKMDEYMMGKFR